MAGSVAQVLEHLPSKHEILILILPKKKKKKKEMHYQAMKRHGGNLNALLSEKNAV
jgi:hypothetical protein